MEKMMTLSDLAEMLSVPRGTLYAWRHAGRGPRGIRVGKHVRYEPAEVRRWLDEQAAAERRVG